jgi:hypothetical protein
LKSHKFIAKGETGEIRKRWRRAVTKSQGLHERVEEGTPRTTQLFSWEGIDVMVHAAE